MGFFRDYAGIDLSLLIQLSEQTELAALKQIGRRRYNYRESRRQNPGDRIQKSGDKIQKTGVRSQKSGVRIQKLL